MFDSKGHQLNVFAKIVYSYHENAAEKEDKIYDSPYGKFNGKVLEWRWAQLLPIARKKSFQVWCTNKNLKVLFLALVHSLLV
jgi:hypothetical protein